jgi:protein-tyrosine phosphatase
LPGISTESFNFRIFNLQPSSRTKPSTLEQPSNLQPSTILRGGLLPQTKRICFVCLGNIIRSPLAEHLFLSLSEQAGVSHKYEVDSAGISAYHVGEQADARMRRVAARHGLHYNRRARQFRTSDFDRFDLIMAMDSTNHRDLLDLASNADAGSKIHLLREYDPQGGPNAPVPDPYYGGNDGFEEVYRVLERSCEGLLRRLEDEGLE